MAQLDKLTVTEEPSKTDQQVNVDQESKTNYNIPKWPGKPN